MVGRLVLIWIVAIVCLTGCQSYKTTAVRPETGQSGLCTAVVDFLRDQNLPELESVEDWHNAYGPGLKLTTAHYEVFTTLLEPLMLRRIPGFVESTYRAYNSQLPEPVETKVRFVIYLFADRAQWEDFTRNFAGEQAEIFCRIQAGAYYHQNVCVAYDIGPDRTFSVLGHEGWHQFNDRHFKFRLPSWLDEGVAMLFEAPSTPSMPFRRGSAGVLSASEGPPSSTRSGAVPGLRASGSPRADGSRAPARDLCEDGSFDFQPKDNAYRLGTLKKTLEAGAMMPLEQLIATTPGDVLATDQTEAVMAFYSQSYALVRFLREAGSGARLAAYRRLLADGLHGDWPLDETSRKIAIDRSTPRNILWNNIVGLILFREYIGDDFESVEQEYLAFCREITNQWLKNTQRASS